MKQYLISKEWLLHDFVQRSPSTVYKELIKVYIDRNIYAKRADIFEMRGTDYHGFGESNKVGTIPIYGDNEETEYYDYVKYSFFKESYINVYTNDVAILYLSDVDMDRTFSKELTKLILNSMELSNEQKEGAFCYYNCLIGRPMKVILEGSDFSGKTTLAKQLFEKYDWAVQERDLKNISYLIREDVNTNTARGFIVNHMRKNPDRLYIFMTCIGALLTDRMLKRSHENKVPLSHFDQICRIFNEKYYRMRGIKEPNFIHIHTVTGPDLSGDGHRDSIVGFEEGDYNSKVEFVQKNHTNKFLELKEE